MRSVASGLHEFRELALQRHIVPHVELFDSRPRQSGEDGDKVQFALGLVGRNLLRSEHVSNNRAANGERAYLFAAVLDGGTKFKFSRLTSHYRPFFVASCGKYSTVLFTTIRSKCRQHSWIEMARTNGCSWCLHILSAPQLPAGTIAPNACATNSASAAALCQASVLHDRMPTFLESIALRFVRLRRAARPRPC
jgi:hypothetical protein